MQLLDDRSAEALVGGWRHKSPARLRFAPSINVKNVITVVPQVAVPVAITIGGGKSSASVGQFVDLGILLG
jgi:hypothetical protein